MGIECRSSGSGRARTLLSLEEHLARQSVEVRIDRFLFFRIRRIVELSLFVVTEHVALGNRSHDMVGLGQLTGIVAECLDRFTKVVGQQRRVGVAGAAGRDG